MYLIILMQSVSSFFKLSHLIILPYYIYIYIYIYIYTIIMVTYDANAKLLDKISRDF